MLGFYAGKFPTRRDQQHVLPAAEGARAAGVGGAGAGAVHLRDQGEPAHHALRAARSRSRVDAVEFLLQEHRLAWRAARADSLPAAAEPQEGSRPAARVPRHAAAEAAIHDRVPARELVRRRRVRRRFARATSRCASPSSRSSRRRSCATASWGYARLHRLDYDEAALAAWAEQLEAQPWKEAYVFFKHDEGGGSGPPAVGAFTRACGALPTQAS